MSMQHRSPLAVAFLSGQIVKPRFLYSFQNFQLATACR